MVSKEPKEKGQENVSKTGNGYHRDPEMTGWSGGAMVLGKLPVSGGGGGGVGRVVRWCWVNFQCRGVLQV